MYPLATLAPTITVAGITAPSYTDILSSLQASFRDIYGADAYLEADSQDGQLLAIFARAIHDSNQAVIAAYNAYSPATAVGEGLSSVVKINNIRRLVATNSQVNVVIDGVAGTTIIDGKVGDTEGNIWVLPSPTVIPFSGTVTVTAVAEAVGAIQAPAGTVTLIRTPTAGWQAVTNPAAAVVGAPIETDAGLRYRQEIAPSLQAKSVLAGIVSAVRALAGVVSVKAYENDTDATDSNGLPEHSISLVVEGGDAQEIGQTIYDKKAPGVTTFGNTSVTVDSLIDAPATVNFSVPVAVPLTVAVEIDAGVDYTSALGVMLKQALVDYVNGLEVGQDVIITRLYVPALLYGAVSPNAYDLNYVEAAISPGTPGTSDLVMTLTQKASLVLADITLTVV